MATSAVDALERTASIHASRVRLTYVAQAQSFLHGHARGFRLSVPVAKGCGSEALDPMALAYATCAVFRRQPASVRASPVMRRHSKAADTSSAQPEPNASPLTTSLG